MKGVSIYMSKKIINYLSFFLGIIMYILILFVFDSSNINHKEISYIYLLAIPCFIILISSFLTKGKDERHKNLTLFFLVYLVALLGFVFSNARSASSIIKNNVYHYSYNFIPFKSIYDALTGPLGLKFGVYNILGNFLMLTPFSVFLPFLDKKFSKTKVFLIFIISITLFIESVQYILNLGSFDIDDVILNISGSLIFYLLIKKTSIKRYFEIIFYKISIKKTIGNIIYFLLFSILLLALCVNIISIVDNINSNKVDISKLKCLNDNRTFITDNNNYHYYSNCDYGIGEVVIGRETKTLEDFVRSQFFSEKYENLLNITKNEIITKIDVKKNLNVGKQLLAGSGNGGKVYLYNIEEMIVYQDGNSYNYKEYIEKEKNNHEFIIDLAPLSEIIYIHKDHKYTIRQGKYYKELICQIGDFYLDIRNTYYLPLDYKINSDSCDFLNNLK